MPKGKTTKPKTPSAEFLLTAHGHGQWCKMIRGKVYFFGVWGEAESTLQKYLDQRDDLQAGRTLSSGVSIPIVDGLPWNQGEWVRGWDWRVHIEQGQLIVRLDSQLWLGIASLRNSACRVPAILNVVFLITFRRAGWKFTVARRSRASKTGMTKL